MNKANSTAPTSPTAEALIKGPTRMKRLWPRITSVFDGYARYQERTEFPEEVEVGST